MKKSTVRQLKRGFYTVIGLLAILLFVCPVPASWAANTPVISDSFEGASSAPIKRGGRLLSASDGGGGWAGSVGGDTRDNGALNYFAYDISSLDLKRGTIEVTLKRANENAYETIFAFVDDMFNQVFDMSFDWGGAKPELHVSTVRNDESVWMMKRVWDLPAYQDLLGTRLVIPNIAKGETVHLLFTWGPAQEENSIFINGKRLQTEIEGVSSIPDMAGRSSYLVFGATLNGPDQAWNMMTSVIQAVKVHERVIDLRAPSIQMIKHNAFEVAGYSGKLVAGDTFTVTLDAEPGGTATFDLVQPASTTKGITTPEKVRITGHPMTENTDNPGTYVGTHAVLYGEDVEDGKVVGHYANEYGVQADNLAGSRPVTVDTKVYMAVNTSNDLIPADEDSKAGITIVAKDANGKVVKDRELKLTLSTTDEYTGTVGGGSFEDLVGGTIDVDWGGVTDSFGEVTAQYVSGFAAKTILVSTKDMVTGDVGVGWVRSFIDGAVDIVVTEPRVSALSVSGSMDVSLSRDWLTADGRSRSRITTVVRDASGKPLSGHSVRFTLLGKNGSIRVIQGKTDSRGRAMADYIAGTIMGQVQVEIRDLTSGMVVLVPIELRPDAPAEIVLAADPAEVVTGGESTVSAKITDANGNPNSNVDVLYDVTVGEGELDSPSVATDDKGFASVQFTAGDKPGLVTVRGTVISRKPTAEEISAAEGAVFLYGLSEDPGRLNVVEWFVEPGGEVVEGQNLLTLEDRRDTLYTVVAPRDGSVSTFVAEERDRVEYGDTLGYVLEVQE